MKIVVIGGGIFTWSFLWSLSKLDIFNQVTEIILISDHLKYPPCSLSSTAIIARRTNEWGNSILGNLIQHSWCWWEYLVSTSSLGAFSSITSAPIYYSIDDQDLEDGVKENKSKFIKSLNNKEITICDKKVKVGIEKSYIVNPDELLNELIKEVKNNLFLKNCPFKIITEEACGVDLNRSTVSLKNNNINFDKLVLQPGAYYEKCSIFQKLGAQCGIGKSEIIFGGYVEFLIKKNQLLNYFMPHSFVYKHKKYQIIYDVKTEILKLGVVSSKVNDENYIRNEILEMYNNAIFDGWNLPLIEKSNLKIGARHKISKRTPQIFQFENCYFHLGGYKIGYLVSFFQSNILARKILSII